MADVAVAGAGPAGLSTGGAPALLSEYILVALGAGARFGLNARDTQIKDGAATAPNGHPRPLQRPTHLWGQAHDGH
jgi:hypothetical protein